MRQEAASTLANLAADNLQNQDVSRQVGAIPLLANLLSSQVPSVQRQAAFALGNLANSSQTNKDAIRTAGAIDPLVTLLGSEVQVVQEKATEALARLSVNNKANELAIAEAKFNSKHALSPFTPSEIEMLAESEKPAGLSSAPDGSPWLHLPSVD